jgi:hypothetical protein
MPIDGPPPTPPFVLSAPVPKDWVTGTELARVMEDGEVLVDWAAVKKARNAFEPQLRHMADLLFAVRHHQEKPLTAHGK